MEPALAIDAAERNRTKVDIPVPVVPLYQSHRLFRQALADVDAVAPPTDLTAVMHSAHLMVSAILRLPQATAVTPRRALVVIRRRCLTQRLMGPLLVVVPPEDGEAPALRPQARGRWRGRLQNHRPMQTLQASILLRLARIDPLRQHTRLHHLHRKRRQAASSHRTKRWPVVRTQHTRAEWVWFESKRDSPLA